MTPPGGGPGQGFVVDDSDGYWGFRSSYEEYECQPALTVDLPGP